uniref:Glycosyltransferase (GlcNAc) n=1 Tax=Trypanosoma congolense (strain IL3000) TaxID=1068625 RepID=G0UMU8_TRYCI|nr:conserved hypothetical protein [Trypanosoma congolense IL3000]
MHKGRCASVTSALVSAPRRWRIYTFVLAIILSLTLVLTVLVYYTLSPKGFHIASPLQRVSDMPPYVTFPSSKLPSANVSIDLATIFVSIASFRDDECASTVESILRNAKNASRVYIGISEERLQTDKSCLSAPVLSERIGVNQILRFRWSDIVPSAFWGAEIVGKQPPPTPILHAGRDEDVLSCVLMPGISQLAVHETGGDILHNCQIITRVGDPDDARGPTYARYLSSLLYGGQNYYMVIDSHTRVVPSWDVKMIERARLMPTRGVLSHYPNGYTPQNPDKELNYPNIMAMCKAVIPSTGVPKLGAHWILKSYRPLLQFFVAAGYIFGDAQFVKDVPFDPYLPYLFEGEEMLYTARLWTSGWDSYCPGDSFAFHNYERPGVPRFWTVIYDSDERQERAREEKIGTLRALYLMRRNVLNSTTPLVSHEVSHNLYPAISFEEERFGMGSERPLPLFWKLSQLSDEFVKAKDSEGRWVGGDQWCSRLEAMSLSLKSKASKG